MDRPEAVNGNPGFVRVGVIGLGAVSATHLEGYRDAEGAQVAGVCDTDEATATQVAARLDVPAYLDFRDLLADPSIDAVALLLPHRLHYPVAKAALEHGKHVCIEKPLAVSAAECQDLIDLAAERRLVLSVTHNTRFATAYVEALRLVRTGQIGPLRLIRVFVAGHEIADYLDAGPRDRWRIESDGMGALIDVGVHYFHLLKWFFGPISTIQAVGRNAIEGIAVEDYTLVRGVFASEGTFSIELNMAAEIPWQERVEIYGSAGSLVIDHLNDPTAVLYRGARDRDGTPLVSVPFDPRGWRERSITVAVADFVDSVLRGRAPTVDPADAGYAVKLVEKAHESMAHGGLTVVV